MFWYYIPDLSQFVGVSILPVQVKLRSIPPFKFLYPLNSYFKYIYCIHLQLLQRMLKIFAQLSHKISKNQGGK